MRDFLFFIKTLLGFLGGFLTWFLGGFQPLIYVLLAFVTADYITGVANAIVDKKLSSNVGFKGLFKKVCIFILVAIASLIDRYVLTGGELIRDIVIFYYLSNEGISILENAALLGLPIPGKLKDILIQLKKGEK